MTNEQLENRLGALVREERRITAEILELIREAEARKLYAQRGCRTLHQWLVKEYGYSDPAAWRRIQAARLLTMVPEAKEKLQEGALNLSTVALVQSALKRTGMEAEEKKEFLSRVEGKTMEETRSLLAQAFPEAVQVKETLRPLNEQESKLTLVLDKEAVGALQRAQELLSHALPGANLGEVIAYLAKSFVGKKDPLERPSVAAKRCSNLSRVEIRRETIRKAEGRCEFVDKKTGRRCGSKYLLEIDHKIPKALGGTDAPANLRCLCRSHNQLEADRLLGRSFMEKMRSG